MEGPDGAEHSGVLSKKKLDHGRFEDPYKQKVQCWIRKNVLFIRALGSDRFPVPGTIPEKIELNLWKVTREKKFRKYACVFSSFLSVRRAGRQGKIHALASWWSRYKTEGRLSTRSRKLDKHNFCLY